MSTIANAVESLEQDLRQACAELEERLRAGRSGRVEDCLAVRPEFAADSEAALDLIYTEFVARLKRERSALVEELCRRFPHWEHLLREQFRLHELVHAEVAHSFLHSPDVPTTPPAAPASPHEEQVGPYVLLDEIARGGMGVLYRARHRRLDRVVALKMPLGGGRAGPEQLAHFRAEAQAVARLQHPHIVQLYEVGEHDGRPFFSLEFVPGGSLAQQLAGRPQPARAAAELVETLARAIHHAHQRGVVHRDLKPANILLLFSREPEASAAGVPALASGSQLSEYTPKITDFGLAKCLEAEGGHTRSGTVVGTPAYMAPEQAAGRVREVGPRTDVYALGVILYELLAGQAPFRAEPVLELLRQVQADEPIPVRRLQPQVPRDLETVCAHCLQKEPARRYASALDLADDLRRFLEGRPLLARPVGPAARGWRWCRRKPVLASLLAALVLVTGLGLTGVLWEWRRASALFAEAERQRLHIKADFQSARQLLTEVLGEQLYYHAAGRPAARGQLEQSLAFFERFAREHGAEPDVDAELAAAWTMMAALRDGLGLREGAREAFVEAAARWGRLAEDRPDLAERRQKQVDCLSLLGRLESRAGRLDRARQHYQDALRLSDGLALDDASVFPTLALASTWYELAWTNHRLQRRDEAVACYEQTLALAGRLAERHQAAVEFRILRGETWYRIGTLHREAGRPADALRALQQGLACWEALELTSAAETPFASTVRKDYFTHYSPHPAFEGKVQLLSEGTRPLYCQEYLSKSYFWIGALLKQFGRADEALASFRRATEVFQALIRQVPSYLNYQRDLAACHHSVGNLLRDLGRPAEAVDCYRRAIVLREKLFQADPDSRVFRSDLGGSWHRLGEALAEAGQPEAAAEAARRSRELQRAVPGPAGAH